MPNLLKPLANTLLAAGVVWACASVAAAQEPPAQDAPRYVSQGGDAQSTPSTELPADARPANGVRERGVTIQTYAVAPGTKFLVSLEGDLGSKDAHENDKFKVRTLEPLEAGSGIYLPAGAEIIGHISRAQSAGVAGHAKLYLTFDEIRTKFGRLPIVAEVVDVPGDHSIKAGEIREGLIEGRHGNQQSAAEAAAAGAAIGAMQGVKDKNKKEALEGAALAAFTAYLAESGRGHELNLPKGAKLELELERALYLLKE